MVDASTLSRTASLRLRQRLVADPYGNHAYRMADGSFVAVSAAEWAALAGAYEEELAPATRQLRWAFGLSIPFAIALLGLLSNSGPLWTFLIGLPMPLQMVVTVGILAGLPLTFLFRHHLAVRRSTEAIDRVLAARPRVQLDLAPRPAALDTLEILALLLVGPYLLLQLAGSLVPGIFSNTPLAATRVDAVGLSGFAVLAALLVCRRRARGPARQDAPSPGRRRRIVAGGAGEE